MTQPGNALSPVEIQTQREAIRHGLARSNLAATAIMVVVALLALAAIATAYRIESKSDEALAATRQAKQELWKSYLAQARAIRLSEAPGRRGEGLAAVAAASRIRTSLELRNEAIALLALTDLEESPRFWAQPPDTFGYDFDPLVERYVRADNRGGLHIHRLEDNAKVMSLTGPSSPALVRRVTPDGKFLTARYLNGEFWIWNLSTGETTLRAQLSADEWNGWGLDISADSQWVAVAAHGANSVYFYEVSTGVERGRLAVRSPSGLALHPTEPRLAVTSQGIAEIRLFSRESGKLLESRACPTSPTCLSWSMDGRLLAAGCPSKEVMLWDLTTGGVVVWRGHEGLVAGCVFNRAGTLLASQSWDGTTRLWDVGTGRSILTTHRGMAKQFSQDDRRLGFVRENLGVGYWSVTGGEVHRTLACAGGRDTVFNVDFSPDGRLVAASKSDGVHVLETATGKLATHLGLPDQWGCPAYFQRDGTALVASGREGISIWPIQAVETNGASAIRFNGRKLVRLPANQEPSELKLSADGRHAVVALLNGQAMLVDLATNNRFVLYTNVASAGSFAFSPDKKQLAIGTRHGAGTRLCNPETGALERQLDHVDSTVEFSPDGRWLVAGNQEAYVLWDTERWEARHVLGRTASSAFDGPSAFSEDGSWLVIKPSTDAVELVEPASGRRLAALRGPWPLRINNLAVSRDGHHAAIAGNDEVQLWNLRALRNALAPLGLDWNIADPGLATVEFSASGFQDKGSLLQRRSFHRSVALILLGVCIAMGFALVAFQRQRQLIHGFARIESLVEQRNRELEAAQSEILHSQKMKALGTLAAGIAHDFNNLLSVIRMSNELIEESRSPALLKQNTAEIEHAVLQGKAVVRSMLGYSRESAGGDGLYHVPEVVRDLLTLLSKQFLGGLTLEFDLNADTPEVRGDRGRLEQILLNLVVNAAEAMKGSGRLRLAVRQQAALEPSYRLRPRSAKRYVEVIVADSGPGIDPETLPRIFEPFFTTKQMAAVRGTGLGLSIVYTLAQADGLGITVESGSVQGTAFRITIPVV